MINPVDKDDKFRIKKIRYCVKNMFVFPQFYGDYYKKNAINICNEWINLPKTKWKQSQVIQLNENQTISDHLISKGIKSFDKFVNHIKKIEYDFWNNRYYEYQKWKNRWWECYRKHGYIDMKTGFRCSGVIGFNECVNQLNHHL